MEGFNKLSTEHSAEPRISLASCPTGLWKSNRYAGASRIVGGEPFNLRLVKVRDLADIGQTHTAALDFIPGFQSRHDLENFFS